ncbi:MAG: LytR C-terminal domain-containing protein [Candidatus Yonathbacteria bacterium]|nr:LytR C-terminal domain-containing protein [Candidatus Yonathbacteria bacterium]
MIIKKNISVLELLRTLKPRDLIYPGILVLFFGIILVVFFFTMQFISKNINKAFSPEENAPSQALDIEKYKLVAKKLNIAVTPASNTAVPAEIPVAEAATTSTPAAAPDKQSITIIIKNSTSKKGVATTLAKALENGGFAKAQTGNEQKPYATTTLFLKESKSAYGAILLEEIRKTYLNAVLATTTEGAVFDAMIIIGVN